MSQYSEYFRQYRISRLLSIRRECREIEKSVHVPIANSNADFVYFSRLCDLLLSGNAIVSVRNADKFKTACRFGKVEFSCTIDKNVFSISAIPFKLLDTFTSHILKVFDLPAEEIFSCSDCRLSKP